MKTSTKVRALPHIATRRLKTEFLVQLDGASTKEEDKILVIGATNLPNQLDKAALRRFSRKVLIDLPDVKAKKAMIGKLLQQVPHKISDSDIADVAYRMERTRSNDLVFSANDVKIAVKEAAMAPIRDHTYEELLLLPKNQLRLLEKKDLVKAIKDNPASLTSKDYDKYKKFGEEKKSRNQGERVGAATEIFDIEEPNPTQEGM